MSSATASGLSAACKAAPDSARPPSIPVTPRRAAGLTAVFLASITAPALWDTLVRPAHQWEQLANLCRSVPTPQALARFSDDLARDSKAARAVRRYYQYLLTRGLHAGSATVIVGADGHLFMREDLLLCTGTALFPERLPSDKSLTKGDAPDSVSSIIAYERQVRAAGIHLLVLPVPLSPVLYPEKIWSGYPATAGPAWNDDFRVWKKRLLTAGVDVVDVTEDLWKARNDPESPWVRHNTHWAPRGAALTAHKLAERIRPWLGAYTPHPYTSRNVRWDAASDLARSLDLPGPDLFPPVPCTARLVLQDGRLATAADDAPILLLGDSFTAEYGEAARGEIIGADLGRQIMLEVGAPVQVITEYGLDPLNARAKLWNHVQALKQKRVIVWEFAARHLAHPGTWAMIPFPLQASAAAR
jgi:alginate O-acetyltransferase complex protein AlgJ